MSQPMTRARANTIRAAGFSAGALLLLATGVMALSGGADPDSVKPDREVKVGDLPALPVSHRIYPDEMAAFISSAYRHEFPEEKSAQPAQTEAPAQTHHATVRLVGVLGSGDRAMAVIGVDADQLLLARGESGADFRVEEIHDDRIVISRRGVRSEVLIGERQGPLTADIRPGGVGGGAMAGGAGGAQSASRGQQMRMGGEDDRADGSVYRSERRAEMEQRQRAAAAARALEASGAAGDEDSNQPRVGSSAGNSFTSAVNGVEGTRTQTQQGGRPAGGNNGQANN